MRTNSFCFLLLLLGTSIQLRAQADRQPAPRATMLYRFNLHPFITEYRVAGTLTAQDSSLHFTPRPCPSTPNTVVEYFSPCFNDHIRPLHVPFERIQHIRRRNIYLFIPSRLYVRERNGKGWLFATYKRGSIIRAFKEYQKAQQTALLSQND